MTAYTLIGSWTNQDLLDAEDNANPERFVWNHERKTLRVKYRTTMTWPFPPYPRPVPTKAPPLKPNPDNYEDAPW